MNDNVVIVYNGEQVSVSKDVADFLEQDRKREQAQEKQDARHLSKSAFETVLSGWDGVKRPVEDAEINLRTLCDLLRYRQLKGFGVVHSVDEFTALCHPHAKESEE